MDYILLNIFCWVAHGPHSNHSRGWYWKEIFKRGVVQSVPCRDTDKAKPHLKNSKPFQTNLSSSSHTIE